MRPIPTRQRRLAPAIRAAIDAAAAAGRELSVVVSLCGTADDPQDREAQAAALVAAGAWVFASNAAAARAAASLTGRSRPTERHRSRAAGTGTGRVGAGRTGPAVGKPGPDTAVLTAPGPVICAGIDLLADALRAQAVDVVAVDYRPDGVRHRGRRRSSGCTAFRARRPAARPGQRRWRPSGCWPSGPSWSTSGRPREALGLRPGEFCHAGPPIAFAGPPDRCAAH